VVENYSRRFRDAIFLPVGEVAPEIALPDTQGKINKLSSLRGKYVLIDFWAAWCGPCRREAPNLVRIYNKYKEKGFEIYGVSLDRDKNSWLGAIESDNLDWVHVSDLKYWQSDVVGLYGFSGIPYTVLIDREGKIIAKGLRGEQLENKLAEKGVELEGTISKPIVANSKEAYDKAPAYSYVRLPNGSVVLKGAK